MRCALDTDGGMWYGVEWDEVEFFDSYVEVL